MEEKPYQDIPLKDLKKHLRNISKAITDARADLAKYKVTKMNEDVYVQLKRAQDEIDGLIMSTDSIHQRVVNGYEVHGYSQVCYKIGEEYYGLPQFGHTHCERIAEEQVPIPAEEFFAFKHEIPNNAKCKGCGKPILPDVQEIEPGQSKP